MAKVRTIWISRDRGEDDNYLFFWQKKPKWINNTCYTCPCGEDDDCECEIANMQDCDDLCRILEGMGVPEDGNICPGQVIEISASVLLTTNETLATNAKDLVKRMKSKGKQPTKREIMKLLTEMSQDAD